MPSRTDIIDLLADAMEIEPSALIQQETLAEHPEWDSLAVLSAMSMIEENFDVSLTTQALLDAETVSGVLALLPA